MTTPPTPYSQRKRPALYWAILEFANLADVWLDSKTDTKVRGCGQILSALRRALTALTHASASKEAAKYLARVRAATNDCEAGFMFLSGTLPKIAAEALQHIDRIVAGVDELEKVDVGEWIDAPLPPLASAESSSTGSNEIVEVRKEVARRISLICGDGAGVHADSPAGESSNEEQSPAADSGDEPPE